ncbi:MAG: cytochrome c [Balneolaceae bacterium]|nr:cytochrome c [Balneolaceae bacterium]MCH8549340.1 cytochrome c [Balneolaceae bacterium]
MAMNVPDNRLLILFVILGLFLTACGDGESWVDDHGYGPVEEPLELGEIDEVLAVEGKQIFDTHCNNCHGMNSSISGPALGRVTENRTPEFVVNYTLNPRENRQNHPVGQELSDQYSGVMADTGISKEEAITILEYLRYYAEFREEPEAGE